MLVRKRPNVSLWLQADIQSLEIDVRFTPKSGHSRDLAGLPLLTHKRHFASMDSPVIGLDVQAGARWPGCRARHHGIDYIRALHDVGPQRSRL